MAKESLRDLCQRLDAAERDRVAERDRATAAEVEAKKAKESQAAVLVQLQVGESVCRRTHPPPCQPTVNHLDRSLCATAADLYPNVVTRRRWVLSRVALLCFFPLVFAGADGGPVPHKPNRCIGCAAADPARASAPVLHSSPRKCCGSVSSRLPALAPCSLCCCSSSSFGTRGSSQPWTCPCPCPYLFCQVSRQSRGVHVS